MAVSLPNLVNFSFKHKFALAIMTSSVYALVDYEDDYVQPLLLTALRAKLPTNLLILLSNHKDVPDNARLLQWRQYESIDFDRLMQNSRSDLANSYVIRKALIRKHYLSNTITHWLSKNPESELKKHVQPSVEFEVDYAEFLDDALLEAYELHESWGRNSALKDDQREWWILKPGMSERGQGIRLFSSEEELTAIFEEWDPPSDEEDMDDSANEETSIMHSQKSDITTSQLRHFVAQPYIHPPLLLPVSHAAANRKFHIRVYVLAVGALKVYIYRTMLALFAGKTYAAPEIETSNAELDAHLTNTCRQEDGKRDGAVHAFWALPTTLDSLPEDIRDSWQQHVWQQICKTTSLTFEAAARTSSIHFQPLPNAFEIFGLDYLVDASGTAWLLEVNAFPDFAQTGDELNGIIENLMGAVVDKAVLPFFGVQGQDHEDDMLEVLNLDLGRR
ncbi:hypothetical protein AMS68_000628 [Peltaster fructicola]|uniref:ATP-grasp domain-containing protein n=1 Tax=Peltaster fructicola TaxID=286661 RepID=A0A6H0XKF1_9PEZI|nr:hypothetical protein AMS68_000628 [Peltaster fructicola]